MTLRILSLGAGVQSTTLLRMILAGELPAVDHAIFSDTGWEPRTVYKHLETLAAECEAANLPLHIVSNGNIREDALSEERRFASMPLHITKPDGRPAMGRRQCTSEYKLKPLLAKQRELAGLLPRQRSTKRLVRTLIGISWDETQRMRTPPFPWIEHEYPLVDLRMTRTECLRWNEEHGFPRPPRSSCIGCPFHSNAEWRAIRDEPDDWADAIDFDRQLRDGRIAGLLGRTRAYLHSSRVPLEDADIRSQEEAGQGTLFDMECEGMCGL
jgi:hypothetical protein